MKAMYSKAVKSLKSKVKHSKETLPKAVGYSAIREEREKERQKSKKKKAK